MPCCLEWVFTSVPGDVVRYLGGVVVLPDGDRHAVRVLVVESDTRVRAALRTLLATASGINVVAEAESRAAALASALSVRPDVVLVSVRPSAGCDGLELLRVLTAELGIPAVAISFERTVRERALKAGASWFFDHNGVLDELLDVLAKFRLRRMT